MYLKVETCILLLKETTSLKWWPYHTSAVVKLTAANKMSLISGF